MIFKIDLNLYKNKKNSYNKRKYYQICYSRITEYFHANNISLFLTETDTESPQVQSCPTETIIQQATRFPYVLEWTEPTFIDNVEVTEVLRDDQPGKAVFTWGLFTVKYSAFDAAGNVAECVININVIRRKFETTKESIVLDDCES